VLMKFDIQEVYNMAQETVRKDECDSRSGNVQNPYYKERVALVIIIYFSEELYFHGSSQNELVLCQLSFLCTCIVKKIKHCYVFRYCVLKFLIQIVSHRADPCIILFQHFRQLFLA
jgi:hypothetical protein